MYQNALRFHSQGPGYFGLAEEAYSALFRTEIFSYADSLAESRRYNLDKGNYSNDDESDTSTFSEDVVITIGRTDGEASSLTQLLYLSYKNHAQFLLDRLVCELSKGASIRDSAVHDAARSHGPSSIAAESLTLFGEALERDDTDCDLWRRTSKIGQLLGSHRIARFCLEAVLLVEANGTHPIIEQQFAAEELRGLISMVQDQISDFQTCTVIEQHKRISESLRPAMDTYPGLKLQFTCPDMADLPRCQRTTIMDSTQTMTSIGRAILQQFLRESEEAISSAYGVGYVLNSSHGGDEEVCTVTEEKSRERRSSTTIKLLSPCVYSADESLQPEAGYTESRGRAHSILALDGTNSKSIVEEPVEDLGPDHQEIGFKNHETLPAEPNRVGEVSAQASLDQPAEETNVVGPAPVVLPTRKRTSESAGLQENEDGGRVRSKRIRAKAELAPEEENEMVDLVKYYSDQLHPRRQADEWLYETLNRLLSRIGLPRDHKTKQGLGNGDIGSEDTEFSLHACLEDFARLLAKWNTEMNNLFSHANDSDNSSTSLSSVEQSGIALFHQYSKPAVQQAPVNDTLTETTLTTFLASIDVSWNSSSDLSRLWLTALLQPRYSENEPVRESGASTSLTSHYTRYTWSSDLKEAVLQSLKLNDEYLFSYLSTRVEALDHDYLKAIGMGQDISFSSRDGSLVEFVQTIFELHLDILRTMTNLRGKVDDADRSAQQYRVKKWAALAAEAISKCPRSTSESDILEPLSLRYLWSSVIHVGLEEETPRDHIIHCLRDMKRVLEAAGCPVITLPNNAEIPEISVEAAEREISKLLTMDFFLNLFNPNRQDPVDVIESLEPLLMETESSSNSDILSSNEPSTHYDKVIEDSEDEGHSQNTAVEDESPVVGWANRDPKMQQMSDFLGKASISLRLYLWKRLRTAYEDIDYPPMVFMCNIKSLKAILQDLGSHSYIDEPSEARLNILVTRLRSLNELTVRSLRLALNTQAVFDCMDERALRDGVKTCVALARLLHVFTTWEDSVAVGQSQTAVQPAGPANTAYKTSMNSLREMYVRVWMLLYLFLKEAVSQSSGDCTASKDDFADYLMMAHHAFGIRHYCSLGKRFFLKFVKSELLSFEASENWSFDIGQILFDLYGFKVCSNSSSFADHGCTPDNLDRPAALEILDFVLSQARRMSVKDLLKTELKSAIDKMQGVIGAPKGSSLLFNRRILNAYLKSPLNPLVVYQAMRGVGALSGTSVNTEFARIAQRGWYFLMGHLMLAKFRSQKRTSPCPTEDLDIAITFFRIDLEFDFEKWESWYRLAQVYDTKIDEDTTWNADKINNHKGDLIVLQKHAIHCYTIAVAVALRSADSSLETAEKMSELYSDFGHRIYSSSREPFSMAVFSIAEYKRFGNSFAIGTYERPPFRPFYEYSAWTLASVLFKQALIEKPKSWTNWYMLGKCLWKIYGISRNAESLSSYSAMLDAFISAIECVPSKRDIRHPDRDPILEPHYKLVSIVHKLVQRRRITPSIGCQTLKATLYSRKVPPVQEVEDWEGYILQVLKYVRAADKANWHHRMVARAAHILYDETTDFIAARAAKHELTQQIFTKTMAIQVWKPEYERAGRHFVYTSRYVSFFVQLLIQLGDRPNLELLGKRVRKKPGDFADHAKVWTEVYMAHLKLLRFQGNILEGNEENVFKCLSSEVFTTNTAHLETWAHSLNPSSSPSIAESTLGILREAIELKKLNANLAKVGPVDDMIGDSFARLYELIVPDLLIKLNVQENRDRMRINMFLMNTDVPSVADPPAPSVPVQGQDLPLARSRSRIVTRKEIGRRAEAVAAKPIVPLSIAKSKPVVCVPAQVRSDESAVQTIDKYLVRKGEGVKEIPSSVPGSVHDSADDESELTEIEEEEDAVVMDQEEEEEQKQKQKLIFPGLVQEEKGSGDDNETAEELEEIEEVEDLDDNGADGDVAEDEVPEEI